MYYGAIKNADIANGTGVRVSLFVSGCTIHCEGCFQPQTWDFTYGKPFTEETENHLLTLLEPSYIRGLTVLGGDPFEPANQKALLPFLTRVRRAFPKKDIWVYSGYRLEELQGTCPEEILDGHLRKSRSSYVRTEYTDDMLRLIDVLIDGQFVQSLKNITLKFRGSENQRLVDLQATLSRQAETGRKEPYEVVLLTE